MKNITYFLLLFATIVNAQTVTIPDANFKALLLAANVSNETAGNIILDANADGEIDFTEAAAVTRMVLFGDFADVTGLEAFTNVTSIYITSTQLSTFDIAGLTSLTDLVFHGCEQLTTINTAQLTMLTNFEVSNNDVLTAVDMSPLVNITTLRFNENQLVTTLDVSTLVNMTHLFCNGYNTGAIETLNLGTISNLIVLSCSDNHLTMVDLSSLVNLENFDYSNNPNMESLDLSSLIHLKVLACTDNNITALDLTALTELESLSCNRNQLTELDLSHQNGMKMLAFDSNQLTTIDLSNFTDLTTLICSGNPGLTAIDVSLAPNLDTLHVSNTGITTVNLTNNPNITILLIADTPIPNSDWDFLTKIQVLYCDHTTATTLDLTNQTHLIDLKFGSDTLTEMLMKNGQNENIMYEYSPNLAYICVDEPQTYLVNLDVNVFNPGHAVIGSYCTFAPGGDYNTVTGAVKFDEDNNGCDENDATYPFNVRMNITNGTQTNATFLNESGNYTFYAQTGTYTLTAQLEHPDYFIIDPLQALIEFPLLDNSIVNQDLCIRADGFHPDLEVVLVPLSASRPGFDVPYQLVYKNKGNQTLSGQVTLAYDDDRTDFVSANPPQDNQNTGFLSWNFTTLHPFETRTINCIFNMNTPLEIPSLDIGDVIHFTAQSGAVLGEETPLDNVSELDQAIVNALDPNDKTCLEGTVIAPSEIGKYVHYNINFENTGTADAINVVVKDVIDTTKFDIDSLQLIATSHAVITKITGNVVEFVFEAINLPPSSIQPIGGHGNVLFKIRTLPTLEIGDEIANMANIYFDYNAPIETNESRSAYQNLSTGGFVKDESISIYPNPTKNTVSIKADSNLRSIELYDVQGRILQRKSEDKNNVTFDVSDQANGIYFLKMDSEKGSAVEKIIKE